MITCDAVQHLNITCRILRRREPVHDSSAGIRDDIHRNAINFVVCRNLPESVFVDQNGHVVLHHRGGHVCAREDIVLQLATWTTPIGIEVHEDQPSVSLGDLLGLLQVIRPANARLGERRRY